MGKEHKLLGEPIIYRVIRKMNHSRKPSLSNSGHYIKNYRNRIFIRDR